MLFWFYIDALGQAVQTLPAIIYDSVELIVMTKVQS
jgi:hypothetical protein